MSRYIEMFEALRWDIIQQKRLTNPAFDAGAEPQLST